VRALNATKLERVFAKPFIGDLDGHKDGVSCFAKHPTQLSTMLSGAYDGEIRVWNLPTRTCSRHVVAHDGWVRGLTYTPCGERFLTIGDDKTIKIWKSNTETVGTTSWELEDEDDDVPVTTLLSKSVILSISHHRHNPIFATVGEVCQIWEETRNEPLKSLQWGVDSLHHVQFNPVENNLLAACASDRSIILYDQREGKALRKVVMTLRANKICWNPMEAFNFTVANEDYNLYTFDSRNLSKPKKIHQNHVAAVTDVDYSPTGREFVSGSYDKTIRIFSCEKTQSREIYHTKRMQHVTCVGWSLDGRYVYSGSDEMNIRLWKAHAAEKLGMVRDFSIINRCFS
jgi:WD repeat and SOF domain-containing protein 1